MAKKESKTKKEKEGMNKEAEKIVDNAKTEEKLQEEVEVNDTEKEVEETAESESPEEEQANEKEQKQEIEEEPIEEKLQKQLTEANDKYLRLSAEFDNYRKRTLKEKIEMTKSASEEVLIEILPFMDNFERAIKSLDDSSDIDAVKEGVHLIYAKFTEFLKKRGLKEIEAMEKVLDTDLHDAITKIPAPDKKLKGKIVDVIEKGYYLYDKVIRHSKVVIGE